MYYKHGSTRSRPAEEIISSAAVVFIVALMKLITKSGIKRPARLSCTVPSKQEPEDKVPVHILRKEATNDWPGECPVCGAIDVGNIDATARAAVPLLPALWTQ
jgi:hypothetical protein